MTVRRPLGRIIADRPGAVNDKGSACASHIVDRPRPARAFVAKGAADRACRLSVPACNTERESEGEVPFAAAAYRNLLKKVRWPTA